MTKHLIGIIYIKIVVSFDSNYFSALLPKDQKSRLDENID